MYIYLFIYLSIHLFQTIHPDPDVRHHLQAEPGDHRGGHQAPRRRPPLLRGVGTSPGKHLDLEFCEDLELRLLNYK